MSLNDYLYPEDITGEAVSNRVGPERHTLIAPQETGEFHFIIPHAGPFYRDTVKLIHVPTGRELFREVDWVPAHRFNSASFHLQDLKGGLYLSILFTDRTLSGEIEIVHYQTIGGKWTLEHNKVLEILSNRLHDPRTETYEQVADRPDVFDPVEHGHDAFDMLGMSEQVEATLEVARSVRESNELLPAMLRDILISYYTKAQVDGKIGEAVSNLVDELSGSQRDMIIDDVRTILESEHYNRAQVDQIVDALSVAIAQRLTIQAFNEAIQNYVTQTALDDILSGYPTGDALAATLAAALEEYVRIDGLAARMLNLTAGSAKTVADTAAAGATKTLVQGNMAGSDYFKIIVGGSTDNGYVEFVVGDNATETIVFSQLGLNGTYRQLTLMDASGNTWLPGRIYTPEVVSWGNVSGYSDIRLKKNIVRIKDALKKTLSLTGNVYDRTDIDLRQAGVLAQEVKKVLPEAVTEDENGYLLVSDSALSALFIETFRDLYDENVELKQQLEKLEHRLERLEQALRGK